MAYIVPNFRTKKALKQALAGGQQVEVFQAGNGRYQVPENGRVVLEGPHFPEPHTWYAEGTMAGGKLVAVK
jgi:hypothetical protein